MVVAESTISTHVSRKALVDLGWGRGWVGGYWVTLRRLCLVGLLERLAG